MGRGAGRMQGWSPGLSIPPIPPCSHNAAPSTGLLPSWMLVPIPEQHRKNPGTLRTARIPSPIPVRLAGLYNKHLRVLSLNQGQEN